MFYKDLTINVLCMWNVKTDAIPVVIGEGGTVSKSFRKYLCSVIGKREIEERQKTAIFVTPHILRKVLM